MNRNQKLNEDIKIVAGEQTNKKNKFPNKRELNRNNMRDELEKIPKKKTDETINFEKIPDIYIFFHLQH
jgi:hypothetical protein